MLKTKARRASKMTKKANFNSISSKRQQLAIYIIVFAVFGGVLLSLSHATVSPTVSIEPENSVLNKAFSGNDTNASSGKYIQFGAAAPDTFVLVGQRLAYTRNNISQFKTANAALLGAANYYLNAKVTSVMDKNQLAASGDKHDYLSLSPYFWPNPATSNGLPYVYRDGQVNPEYYDVTDHQDFLDLVNATNALMQGYYFTRNSIYSTKAELMIRTWFIDSATKMNPNLTYAQLQKGSTTHNTGAATGVIEFSNLPQLIDDVKILQTTPNWTSNDQTVFTTWCIQYLNWLQTSAFGISETGNANNHGTWSNTQIASLAEFIGNHAVALAAVNKVKGLISTQIAPDGKQTGELTRTKPWNYSTFNLAGLISIAQIGMHENVNLWTYTAPSGGSIHKALDFLAPYANGTKDWQTDFSYDIATTFAAYDLTNQLRQSASSYNNPVYSTDADLSQTVNLSKDYSPLLY